MAQQSGSRRRNPKRRLREYRRRWFLAMGIIMAAVIASILTLILTVTEVIPAEPWEAVAITVGGVAAICSLVVTMIEAAFEPNEIDAPRG